MEPLNSLAPFLASPRSAGGTFAVNVSQIYDGDENPVEVQIEREKAAN
jgi:hypothetical protein